MIAQWDNGCFSLGKATGPNLCGGMLRKFVNRHLSPEGEGKRDGICMSKNVHNRKWNYFSRFKSRIFCLIFQTNHLLKKITRNVGFFEKQIKYTRLTSKKYFQ